MQLKHDFGSVYAGFVNWILQSTEEDYEWMEGTDEPRSCGYELRVPLTNASRLNMQARVRGRVQAQRLLFATRTQSSFVNECERTRRLCAKNRSPICGRLNTRARAKLTMFPPVSAEANVVPGSRNIARCETTSLDSKPADQALAAVPDHR